MTRRDIAGRTLAAATLVAASCLPSSAAAAGLDLRGWLGRPGVKLVAVEFYASWCKPCVAAAPKWREIHQRYRADGLRLIVVATEDPEGCAGLGFGDATICDDDGRIFAMIGGGKKLPAAYLWSWQGKLLAREATAEQVSAAIEGWFKEAPRVLVEASKIDGRFGIQPAALTDMVKDELSNGDKLVIVAGDREKARLDKMRADAMRAGYSEDFGCEVGNDLPPNSLLDVQIIGADEPRLRLALFSATAGCLVASGVAPWNRAKAKVSVAEATAALIDRLRPEIEMPRGRALGFTGAGTATGPSSSGPTATRPPPAPTEAKPPPPAPAETKPPSAPAAEAEPTPRRRPPEPPAMADKTRPIPGVPADAPRSVSPAPSRRPGERLRVAVLEIESREGVGPRDASRLSDRVRIGNVGRYVVLGSEQMTRVLRSAGVDPSCGARCAPAIARELDLDLVITGSVRLRRDIKEYELELELRDPRRGKIVKRQRVNADTLPDLEAEAQRKIRQMLEVQRG